MNDRAKARVFHYRHEAELARTIHRIQHLIERGGLEIDIARAFEFGVHGDQEIGAIHLNAMAGKIDHRHIRAIRLGPEILKRAAKAVIIEIKAWLRAGKIEAGQGLADGFGVVGGILQDVGMPVNRITDHQRDTLLSSPHPRHIRLAFEYR